MFSPSLLYKWSFSVHLSFFLATYAYGFLLILWHGSLPLRLASVSISDWICKYWPSSLNKLPFLLQLPIAQMGSRLLLRLHVSKPSLFWIEVADHRIKHEWDFLLSIVGPALCFHRCFSSSLSYYYYYYYYLSFLLLFLPRVWFAITTNNVYHKIRCALYKNFKAWMAIWASINAIGIINSTDQFPRVTKPVSDIFQTKVIEKLSAAECALLMFSNRSWNWIQNEVIAVATTRKISRFRNTEFHTHTPLLSAICYLISMWISLTNW